MNPDRRTFLKSSGSLMILFGSVGSGHATNDKAPAVSEGSVAISGRLSLHSTGKVVMSPGKVELGQGVLTALAQIAAEELHIDIARISINAVDTDFSPDESYTFSSISVQKSGALLRQAAASGYHYLINKASKMLDVDRNQLHAVDGEIFYLDKPTTLDFWQVLRGQNQSIVTDHNLQQERDTPYRVVGKSIPRLDIPAKVFGQASYLQDMRLPDMVHARVVHPPAPRATLIKFSPDKISALPGVIKVVRDGNFIAVIAQQEQQARTAVQMLSASLDWSLPEDLPSAQNIFSWLQRTPSTTEVVAEKINTESGNAAVRKFTARYQRPYHCHASISPSAALALFSEGKLTVWSHAQGMYPLRAALSRALALPQQQIRCIHREASGCYGHNGADDAACEAAVLATHLPGRAVRLQWERRDEFNWEPLGSAMQIEISAGIDDKSLVSDWDYDLWSCAHSGRPRNAADAGNLLYTQLRSDPLPLPPARSVPQPNGGADRNAIPLYDFAGMRITKHLTKNAPLRTSALRGLGAYANVFAIESFMDELADNLDQDPLEFRLRHLKDERAIELLRKLAELSHWKDRPAAGNAIGWGIGFAQFKNLSSYLGVVAQLRVESDQADIMLDKVIAVCDAGLVINPDGLRAQIEGGIIQSASWTLKEELKFSQTRVLDNDWLDYPILRFDEIPDIEIHLMPDQGRKALGVGETAQGPTAAAIGNAVHHASGQRLRKLPLQLASQSSNA